MNTSLFSWFYYEILENKLSTFFIPHHILAHIPHKDKDAFAQNLKTIWLAPTREQARRLAEEICRQYEPRFPKAIRCLEDGLEDSLAFYAFPQLDARKISSTNVLERLNRRSAAVRVW